MLDKWFKKEKPVFTGITRGIGGFGFGKAAGGGGGAAAFSASGGNYTKTPDNNHNYHTFSTPGNFTVTSGTADIECLIVGGGGAADGERVVLLDRGEAPRRQGQAAAVLLKATCTTTGK